MEFENLVHELKKHKLDQPLSRLVQEFLQEFSNLPKSPDTFNPHYMQQIAELLVENICTTAKDDLLWWEMNLFLARNWAADRGQAGQAVIDLIDQLTPILRQYFNDDDALITLQEITNKSLFGVIMLSETLSVPKRYFVAPNAISIAQAHFSEKAWFRAICAGRTPVGFMMLSIDQDKHDYYLWRFMIAECYQGRGYGRKAMEVIKDYVRSLPQAKELVLSYGQGPSSPEGFYRKLGFLPTGEVDYGEVVAKISLAD